MKKLVNSWIPKVLAIVVAVGVVGFHIPSATAASLTSMSDNMNRLQISTAANHTIQFVTPTGVAAGQSITLTFSSDFTGVSAIDDTDVDLATAATCSGFSDKTVAAAASGATWGATASGQVVTIISGTDTITATHCVQIEIGLNATFSGTGNEQISNGAADDDDSIIIGGTMTDTGTIGVDIITDDTVLVSATVGPNITFVISDTDIGFSALSAVAERFATSDGTGSATEVEAHTLAASTNATSGYVIYMSGATLTDGGNSITAIGSSNTASNDGTEQFGVRFTETGAGTGTVSAPYAASGFAYDTGGMPDTIATAAGATDTSTYGARYLANIDINTEAGNYTTNITYTATATY